MSTASRNHDNIVTVDVSRHSKLRVKANPSFAHASGQHVVAITLSELAQCASTFPVALVRRPDDGRYMPAVMLGFQTGENVYAGPEFWECTYVPMAIRRHPFVIGYDDRVPDGEEITTCLDTSSPFLSETQGTALFTEDGQQTDFLKDHDQLLNYMFESQKLTDRFIQAVDRLGLIVPFDLLLQQQNGDVRRITGLYTLDEMKLKELDTTQLRELHQNDQLAACYIIVASLHQLNQMIKLRNRKGRGQDQITGFNIDFNPAPQAVR